MNYTLLSDGSTHRTLGAVCVALGIRQSQVAILWKGEIGHIHKKTQRRGDDVPGAHLGTVRRHKANRDSYRAAQGVHPESLTVRPSKKGFNAWTRVPCRNRECDRWVGSARTLDAAFRMLGDLQGHVRQGLTSRTFTRGTALQAVSAHTFVTRSQVA